MPFLTDVLTCQNKAYYYYYSIKTNHEIERNNASIITSNPCYFKIIF